MDLNEIILRRTDFLVISDYPRDYRDCVRQAVDELVDNPTMSELATLFNLTRDEFKEDMCGVYDRFVRARISSQWK